ncbi:MAG: 6-carboxytetrahydropterin synthase QueD [Peptococcaceae bacterium]|nr:6-carboxytetrahydropterin synthase QueD [Peptococcaceae bacterium]
MFKLTVKKDFAAAHKLDNYQGSCAFLHGHTWLVEATVCGEELDDCGMLIDFKILKSMLGDIIKPFDHSYLNDLEIFNHNQIKINPTAENLAHYIFQEMKRQLIGTYPKTRILAVMVCESPEASAVYQEA